ncbi:DUF5697 family protein [Pseudoflavonifractor phocaeensis]|uniref:DUF5697 family protein n=1 Tax=Pseudoflavonifractor phocaeensis TaxID=1870988 RepID=UPI00195D5990|nr:hypothetical protein [Pseudoflavonifractor phocaeensis]
MKTREALYRQEAAGILRDLCMYRALTEAQLLRLYPGRQDKVKNLLSYLVRQGRVRRVGETYFPAGQSLDSADPALTASVWVLLDFIDQVEFHAAGDYPATLIFFAGGQVYEIVRAAPGKEEWINRLLEHAEEHASQFIVLVDGPEQIPLIRIPNVRGFCTVSPQGTVQYYQTEGACI